jgi:bifunctional ADP-heptose synthase (sugar kinase/adenylyltransferase)
MRSSVLHFRKFNTKYISPEALEDKIFSLKSEGKKIVTLNGSFDMLHAGHLKILEEAAKQIVRLRFIKVLYGL